MTKNETSYIFKMYYANNPHVKNLFFYQNPIKVDWYKVLVLVHLVDKILFVSQDFNVCKHLLVYYFRSDPSYLTIVQIFNQYSSIICRTQYFWNILPKQFAIYVFICSFIIKTIITYNVTILNPTRKQVIKNETL